MMFATTDFADSLSWLFVFLQADGGRRGTPLIIVIILILLVLALFWWGLTRNRVSGDTTGRPDVHSDHHIDHTAHGAAQVYGDSDELDLDPADLNVGRVPDVEAIATPSSASMADPMMVELDEEEEVEQPIQFEAVDLDATGTIPPGDEVEQELPPTRIAPVDIDSTGNMPSVLEDQSELAPMEAAAAPDDLKIVEGIGPRIADVLAAAGITTFAQLSMTDVAELERILRDARLAIANPGSWPRQAELAANGRWDDLRQLQDQLKGGRSV